MKLKSLFCLGILAFLSLTGCKKQASEHVHSYDKENIEWVWSETSSGGYSAKAILSCTSCDESKEGHSVEIDATVTNAQTKAPTCATPGTMTYTASISFEGESYSATKEKAVTDSNAHHYIDVVDPSFLKSAATCTEDAIYYKSCEFCHEKSEETFSALNTKLGHHMIHHSATSATCQVEGNIEYYECDRCHKLYLEEAGTTEVTQNDVVIPTAHHYIEVQDNAYLKSPATCTEDATYYKSCEFCHELSSETFTVPNTKLGHQMVHQTATTSTCQEHGHIEHYECERCHKYFADEQGVTELSENDVILPLSHNMTHHAEVPASCTTDGTAEYYTCSYEPGVLYKDEAGTQTFADASELVIEKLGHQFNESLNCVEGDATLKEEYGMADATVLDSLSPATTSDMGFTSGNYVDVSPVHTFLDYNFLENGGADIWMKYRYSVHDGTYDEAALQLYLLNNHSEDGFRIRLDNRAEDDGIAVLYVFSSNQYNNPGTDNDIPSAPSGSAQFFFPRPSGFKSNVDIIMHFGITLIDPVKNIFSIMIEAGANGTLYQVSSGAEAGEYNPRSFNIEMGESFAGWTNKSIRMTAKRSNDIKLSDYLPTQENVLIYKNTAGELVGKINNPGTARIPNLISDNKTFLGWFDTKGNKVKDGDTINGKVVITPRFVDNKPNMFVPSDTIGNNYIGAKDGWVDATSTGFSGATSGKLPVTEISDSYDFYFIYHFVSRSANDNYAIFALPFDFTDAQTRIETRIDNPSNSNLVGYISGSNNSLGNAGAAGTNFSSSGFRANGSDLLIHMTVSNTSLEGLTFELEIVNLGNGQTYQTSRNVTFNNPQYYSLNNPLRNMFDCVKVNCEYRITDAF